MSVCDHVRQIITQRDCEKCPQELKDKVFKHMLDCAYCEEFAADMQLSMRQEKCYCNSENR